MIPRIIDAVAMLLFCLGALLWIINERRDLRRSEEEYRRQQAIFDRQMKALLGVKPDPLPPPNPEYVQHDRKN